MENPGQDSRIDCGAHQAASRLFRHIIHPIRLTYSTLFPGTTRFEGEFGHECLSVIPYAYALSVKGILKKTVSFQDTGSLYYFSGHHEELDLKRMPEKNTSPLPVLKPNHSDVKGLQWEPPPYKTVYQGANFGFQKPPLIISNKYNSEWDHAPVNYFDLDMLENMIEILRDHYQIIYNRYTVEDDNSKVFELGDFDFIRMKFKDVLFMNDLSVRFPEWSINELQLRVYAECENFISVQGGASILCSYFGGKNLIYARKGIELISDEFTVLYPLLSGAEVLFAPYKKEDLKYHQNSKLSIPQIPHDIRQNFISILKDRF